jgi:carnosine N-methyltransferase
MRVERDAVHVPIISAVQKYVPGESRILVPGASACRLVYDLASLGYNVVGIEHDPLRLGIAEFVLNDATTEIEPFVLETCNRLKAVDNVTSVTIPDVSDIDPSVLARISIDANEFLMAASQYEPGSFSCIVTCFFLDCESVNLTACVNACSRLLSPNGVWINSGPLNYHYGGSEKIVSPHGRREQSLAELQSTVTAGGFNIIDESEILTTYLGNPKTIMDTLYRCFFFVAKLSN